MEYTLISQAPDFRDCLLGYLEQSNITRAMLADYIHVSPAAMFVITSKDIAEKSNNEIINKISEQTEIELRLPDHSKPFDKRIQTDRNVHIDPDGLGTGNLFNQ